MIIRKTKLVNERNKERRFSFYNIQIFLKLMLIVSMNVLELKMPKKLATQLAIDF